METACRGPVEWDLPHELLGFFPAADRDLIAVLGVLVREYQRSGGCDRAGLVAVHALHLLGPFPALIVKVETERTDARFRRDRNLVEHSVHGSICPFHPDHRCSAYFSAVDQPRFGKFKR